MKLYAVEDMLKEMDSRYLLVNVVAHRARELSVDAEREHVSLEEKPVTTAIDEAVAGTLPIPEQE